MDHSNIRNIVDLDAYPLEDDIFTESCKTKINANGVLTLPNFLNESIIKYLVEEASDAQHMAFFSNSTHNVYLTKNNPEFGDHHIFNRQVVSSKGCITDDQVPDCSPLKTLYNSKILRDFLACVLGEQKLYEYADGMSSINVHYASEGEELGWHFDNSSFAITLLLQAPDAGGSFEYVKDLRDAEAGEMNFEGVESLLDGVTKPQFLKVEPGTLVLFRGKNSIHRVTPTIGNQTRILVVLAYNAKPGISLSKSAQMTFFGRTAD